MTIQDHSTPEPASTGAAGEGAVNKSGSSASGKAASTNNTGGCSPPVHETSSQQEETSGHSVEATTADQCAVTTADKQIAELAAALEVAKDAELRARAELDNFRKRMRREQEEQLRYANWSLLRDLLDVLDNLTRAVQAAEQPSADVNSLLQGVKIVADQLQQLLAKYHCKRIAAQGQPFDPCQHQAVAQSPSTDLPPGTIAHVVREGYLLHDRVLRPAEVIVTTAPTSAPPQVNVLTNNSPQSADLSADR